MGRVCIWCTDLIIQLGLLKSIENGKFNNAAYLQLQMKGEIAGALRRVDASRNFYCKKEQGYCERGNSQQNYVKEVVKCLVPHGRRRKENTML